MLLDQVSRNIHRGDRAAFEGDRVAVMLAKDAVEKGWDEMVHLERRAFLYRPLMRSEDRETQTLSRCCFERLGDEENLSCARDHAEVIARSGRFPSRNAALGRQSTPEEIAYLSRPDAGW